MTVRLESDNLREMVVDWPVRMILEKEVRINDYQLDNEYVKATFKELRTPDFCVADLCMVCKHDTKIYSKANEYNAVWFCAALQGNVSCFYNPITRCEEWNEGEANLLSYDGTESCTCFNKNVPFRMKEIMLSMDYIKELALQYPELFRDGADSFFRGKQYRAYRKNRNFCPGIYRALNDIMQSHISGNIAAMYADAKVREILSLFLCQSDEKECAFCPCYTEKDKDKLRDAKIIIEQNYLNPPSLRQLALMIGTNECTLKKGFKELFKTTVFGYIFDYRMDLACRYLLDSDKAVQEIGFCVGYEHHAHFSRAFKRKFGVSPLEYRSIGNK
ncbi:MAG: hypothetical protein PARBA_02626 [Parabacteroides sp.]